MHNSNFSSNRFRGCWIDWHRIAVGEKSISYGPVICMNVGNGFRMKFNHVKERHICHFGMSSILWSSSTLSKNIISLLFFEFQSNGKQSHFRFGLTLYTWIPVYRFVFCSHFVCCVSSVYFFCWCAWLKVSTSFPQRILLFSVRWVHTNGCACVKVADDRDNRPQNAMMKPYKFNLSPLLWENILKAV